MTIVPSRIQLRRVKGWRKPNDTVVVARPTKWGNPFRIGEDGTAAECVEKFRSYIGHPNSPHGFEPSDIEQLRGKNLACWCSLNQPCHADVLLEIANADQGL